eukprot:3528115-Pyramimonas_sp.AAC.1
METPWVDVELLRALVGAWLRGALLRREPVAAPAAVFDLLEKRQGQVALVGVGPPRGARHEGRDPDDG